MPLARTNGTIDNLLERMTNDDKDFRFMATNDLMSELQKETVDWDEDCETNITRNVISLLKDRNGEVQNLAVKCLGYLISKIKDARREMIISSLCNMMVCGSEGNRDISSMALKTIVPELPTNDQMVSIINSVLNPNLLKAISNTRDVTVQLESLEILSELINRVGVKLSSFHEKIQVELIKQLSSDRSAVRKRSMNALSNLLACCSDELFNSTLAQLHEALKDLAQKCPADGFSEQNSYTVNTTKTLLQCIATIIRFAGHRSNINQLQEMIPVICSFCKVNNDEIREHSLQAFESYVKRCPVNISETLPEIIKICLSNISHDPNYNYCDNENVDDQMDCDQASAEGPDDYDDDDPNSIDDYSDDDDLSWKVRRASAKCLEAIILARRDLVNDFLQVVVPALVMRFKEREESVKADILQTFVTILRQTRSLVSETKGVQVETASRLESMVPSIVIKSTSLWRDKFLKSRQLVLQIFTEIINIIPNALSEHLTLIVPAVLFSLSDKNATANMRMDALIFFQELLKTHEPTLFHPRLPNILELVLTAVGDTFYKIASEALTLLSHIIFVMRPSSNIVMNGYENILPAIYEKILDRISQAGIDTEVRERAISCMGDLVATFGDKMGKQHSIVMNLIFEKLNNETNRLTSAKALTKIISSPLNLPLDCLFPQAFTLLSSFLRKNSRQLRITTLTLINTVLKRSPEMLDKESVDLLLNNAHTLITENDLHVSQLSLNMITSIVKSGKADHEIIQRSVVPGALDLIQSPLLQGSALQAILTFFSSVVALSVPGLDHQSILKKLVEPIYNGQTVHKQTYGSTAKVVSAISRDDSIATTTLTQLINDFISKQDNHHAMIIILLSLGEIGKTRDLGSIQNIENVLLNSLNSNYEDVKLAGSYALGCVAVGSLHKFLPMILEEIEARNKRQYLIFHSLREVISCGKIEVWDTIWELLIKHCECPEEGTRNVVSECLGKMALQDPSNLLPRLMKLFKEDFANKPLAKSTIVAAIKFTISDQQHDIDHLLRQCIGDYLLALRDPDIEVRRSALVLFNSAAHNKHSLIINLLPTVLPLLYEETLVKPELKRSVEMGPFKHEVDDGLDTRKAAFECMYTLLDNCQSHLDVMEFLTYVEKGLRDHYDIKMLTYLMLGKLVTLSPSAVLQRMESLLMPIEEVCRSRPKDNAVKQEHERQDELKRSALRAFDTLRSIPDADRHPVIVRFHEDLIKRHKTVMDLYNSIHRDSTTVHTDSHRMDLG